MATAYAPIEGITPRVQEIGRIRMGDKNDRDLPVSLPTFRLTSYDQTVLAVAADLYGGTVREWNDAPTPGMFELVTASKALDILIPRSLQSVTQAWELWTGGVCERRCDGRVEQLSGGPCICGPQRGESDDTCDVVTRLSVILPRIPGLGLWRLDTGGYNAATTIPSTLELLLTIDQRAMVPATLRAVERSSKVRKPDGKVITRRFIVPVLDAPGITIGQLVESGLHDAQALPETVERPRPMTAEERVAARAAAVRDAAGTSPAPTAEPGTPAVDNAPEAVPPPVSGATDEPGVEPAAAQGEAATSAPSSPQAPIEQCESMSPYDNPTRCQREVGHTGTHRNRDKESWT